MDHPRLLLWLFLVFFKQTKHFFQQINVKKCPSSKQCRDLNPQLSDCESHHITSTTGVLLGKPNNGKKVFPGRHKLVLHNPRRFDLSTCRRRWWWCQSLPVWPDKNRQMSVKLAQKWFNYKNDRFWHLYKNCLRTWEIRAN